MDVIQKEPCLHLKLKAVVEFFLPFHCMLFFPMIHEQSIIMMYYMLVIMLNSVGVSISFVFLCSHPAPS